MSVASVSSCPILLSDDVLTLHKDVTIEDHSLVDIPLSARHAIHDSAMVLFRLVASTTTYGKLLQQGLPESDVRTCLGFVHSIGGLRIRRGRRLIYYWALIRSMGIGILPRMTCRRYPATPYGIGQATLRACMPVLFSSIPVAALVAYASLASTSVILATEGVFVSALLVSVFGHELGHLACIKQAHANAITMQQGMRLGIIHTRLLPRTELRTAILGPCAGIFICCLYIAAGLAFARTYVWYIGALVALTHLGAFLPWYGDGKSIVRLIKNQKGAL